MMHPLMCEEEMPEEKDIDYVLFLTQFILFIIGYPFTLKFLLSDKGLLQDFFPPLRASLLFLC